MKPDVVVDVGNTRIKWGRCDADRVVEMASLPPNDAAWAEQMSRWSLPAVTLSQGVGWVKRSATHPEPGIAWMLAGVHPERRDGLAEWLRSQGAVVQTLDSFAQLPLAIEVEHPAQVGLDRLLNALAANTARDAGRPALIVDAGSAVTVDWLDANGAFRGGAIFPGLRLMAQALHSYTAKLPLVDVKEIARYPGTATDAAIRAGIVNAAVGGIERIARQTHGSQPHCFLTGGDAPLLAAALGPSFRVWPEMTLEGIRLAATRLP